MHLENIKSGKRFVLCHEFKVCTGERYTGRSIGDDDYKRDCLKDPTQTWERNNHTIRKTAGKYHQESYAMVVRAIQSELTFLQRVMKNKVYEFMEVKKMLWDTFLHRLSL